MTCHHDLRREQWGAERRAAPGGGPGAAGHLAGLVDERLTLAKHGANSGTKALTLIGSMLAGGDSIDDVGVLRSGATGSVLDATRTPSTIGSWLRAHKWFNVRQLDAVSRELLARLWEAGAGPADLAAALTIDIDLTIVQVHGRDC